MIFQEWIESVSLVFGQSSTNTAIIMSFILIILIDVLIVMNMKENSTQGLFFVDFVATILFIFMGWLPTFTGSIIALIFAGMFASLIRDKIM